MANHHLLRFNRTFMELKFRYGLDSYNAVVRFNRTFMELKWRILFLLEEGERRGLIVPLWN